jgi:Flp pilus assembly pilin Flp
MLTRVQAGLAAALARLEAILRRDRGQALVEYALVLSLVVIVCIGVLSAIGHNVSAILLNPIAHSV